MTGGDLAALTGWSRNHYDRLVHLAFGLLFVPPAVEVAADGRAGAEGRTAGSALSFVLSVSCLYEIFEWGLALTLAGDMAEDYNGQQGDMWDAQKDMALALLGALIASGWMLARKRR